MEHVRVIGIVGYLFFISMSACETLVLSTWMSFIKITPDLLLDAQHETNRPSDNRVY